MATTTYLETKPRYEILDGLRGVAAMTVVAFHLFETYSRGPEYQTLNHGYLAVDFFFVLSGFVIGYAYDDRWGKMSTWGFFKRRLARLHPMVIMGGLIGVIFFYFGSCDMFPLIGQTPWWKLLLMFLLGCTMIPAGPKLDIRGWQETYPINGPQWSLMLEYIANILYAFIFRRLGKIALGVCVALAACMTIDLGMNLNLTGLFTDTGSPYTFIGGWGIHGRQLYIAIARLFYPFLCGLLISHLGKFIKVRGGFWWCSLLVFAALVMPRVGGVNPTHFWMNGIYETSCILFLFPFIVAMGAGSKVTDNKSMAVCKFLGDISFPLYITHYPLIYLQMAWAANHHDAPMSQHIMVSVGLFFLAIFMAYALLKIYDIPVRNWLKDHWLHRAPKAA
jgi:peptidoglycan/LPS O-acetylase OafA/YrhL